MKKQCFVIMPYGRDESEKKEFSRVYNFIIKIAVEGTGLTCIRSDFEGKGGHILSNVINDLAESQIVIADLSTLNWNVAYELGMRQVFSKNGTILICNSQYKEQLPFDIQSQNIYFYPSDWLDDYEKLSDDLKQIIQGRLSGKTTSDSPVHEKYAYLPESVVEGFSGEADERLKDAKERIAQLEKELAETHKRIDSMGLSLSEGEETEAVDYSQMFIAELENSIYNSDTAVAKLRELLEREDKKEFLEFLGKVLSDGFLDEDDCRAVYYLCKELKVPAITRKYLETVLKFYPESDDLSCFLANEYSKNYHNGDRALQMVNSIIGVAYNNGKFVLSKTAQVTPRRLAAFFDVYIHLKKYAEMAEIGALLQEKFKDNTKILPLILRNLITACVRMNELESAKRWKEQLLAVAPSDALTHWACSRYEIAAENYIGAIEETEMCIRLEDEDTDYYNFMAGRICDNLYARDPETLNIKKISPKEADRYAVPFLLVALKINRNLINETIDFLRRNKFNAYIAPLIEAYQSGAKDFAETFPELDFGAVAYCMNLPLEA